MMTELEEAKTFIQAWMAINKLQQAIQKLEERIKKLEEKEK